MVQVQNKAVGGEVALSHFSFVFYLIDSFFYRLGSSEVEQVQCVVDGVKLLIEMEKRLEAGIT